MASDKELEKENDELRSDIHKCKERIQELEKKLGQISHVDVPTLFDEVQALPGIEFALNGKVYYSPGDKGRVAKNSTKTETDGIDRLEVAWYRTGLVSTMKTDMWLRNFRFCGFGRIPVLGDEVECLPGVSLILDGNEFYREGDKGRVCKDSTETPSDGINRFEVTWYRTGKASTMKTDMWVKNFKFVTVEEISGFDERTCDSFISKLDLDDNGGLTSEALKRLLTSGALDPRLRKRETFDIHPKLADEMEVLPGISLVVDGKEYYAGGDRGRVSKETYTAPADGIKRFEVTWYRTGLVSAMKLEAWLKNFRYIGKAIPVPRLGEELLCLNAAELIIDGKEYYKPGDKGRVCKDEYPAVNDNIKRIEITWYRTGLTSTMKTEVWFKYFKVLGNDPDEKPDESQDKKPMTWTDFFRRVKEMPAEFYEKCLKLLCDLDINAPQELKDVDPEALDAILFEATAGQKSFLKDAIAFAKAEAS